MGFNKNNIDNSCKLWLVMCKSHHNAVVSFVLCAFDTDPIYSTVMHYNITITATLQLIV